MFPGASYNLMLMEELEAVAQRFAVKKVFLKISQNSPENTYTLLE